MLTSQAQSSIGEDRVDPWILADMVLTSDLYPHQIHFDRQPIVEEYHRGCLDQGGATISGDPTVVAAPTPQVNFSVQLFEDQAAMSSEYCGDVAWSALPSQVIQHLSNSAGQLEEWRPIS